MEVTHGKSIERYDINSILTLDFYANENITLKLSAVVSNYDEINLNDSVIFKVDDTTLVSDNPTLGHRNPNDWWNWQTALFNEIDLTKGSHSLTIKMYTARPNLDCFNFHVKKYGETVVFSNLNYTFENACIYGLVGRNGAGKTTLLNILSNYDKNYTGVISIDRKKMNKVDYLDMPVAYAMDQPSFFNELTIYENLLLIASSRKIKKQEAFDKIERILDGLGLKKYENYSPLELSKGTMQRLNNACAMIQEEKITIFDEPFSGLDPVQMKLLENVIVEFHKKEKGIYIISSHDIECLQNVCDKCLLLHNGQIREINMEEVDREEIAKILSEGE